MGYCKNCEGRGQIETGIAESSSIQCRRCDGPGEEPDLRRRKAIDMEKAAVGARSALSAGLAGADATESLCDCGKGVLVETRLGKWCSTTLEKYELQNGETKRCGTCAHWKKRDYRHCMNSGPWGALPQIGTDPECQWKPRKATANSEVTGRAEAPDESAAGSRSR